MFAVRHASSQTPVPPNHAELPGPGLRRAPRFRAENPKRIRAFSVSLGSMGRLL